MVHRVALDGFQIVLERIFHIGTPAFLEKHFPQPAIGSDVVGIQLQRLLKCDRSLGIGFIIQQFLALADQGFRRIPAKYFQWIEPAQEAGSGLVRLNGNGIGVRR